VGVVHLDAAMEAQLRVVGATFLHNRQRDDLRIAHLQASGIGTTFDPVGGNFSVEFVNDAVERKKQVVGRDGRNPLIGNGHDSRKQVQSQECVW